MLCFSKIFHGSSCEKGRLGLLAATGSIWYCQTLDILILPNHSHDASASEDHARRSEPRTRRRHDVAFCYFFVVKKGRAGQEPLVASCS